MRKYFYYNSPIGVLTLISENGYLIGLYFGEKDIKAGYGKSEVIVEAISQLEDYFKKKRKNFDLPLKLKGTEFQEKCWDALQEIPYGETRTYKDIAEAVNSPKAYRAVGLANNRNPISIIVPCHRVIGANGKLVGYGGGLDKKEFLLKLEKEKL